MNLTDADLAKLRQSSLGFLAPAFRSKAEHLLQMMEGRGHDPVIFETLRLPAVQAEYFRRKTSRQKDVLWSMHGHGLAIDVISKSVGWNYSSEWKEDLQDICAELQLTCGGLWKNPVDWPHVQWGTIPGAVPKELVAAYNSGGLYASWKFAEAL